MSIGVDDHISHEPSEPLTIKESITNRAIRLIKNLIETATTDKNTLELDPEKALQVLDLDSRDHPAPFSNQEISPSLVQNLMRRTIKGFVDDGIVPTDLVLEISKRFKPSYIGYEDLYSNYEAHYVGQNSELDLKDEMQFKSRESMDSLQTTLREFGINLLPEQISEIIFRGDLGHEYGHAVEAVFVRKAMVEMTTQGEDLLGGDLDQESLVAVSLASRSQVQEKINQLFPLDNPKLIAALQKLEDGNTLFQSEKVAVERISTGFELLAIKRTLIDFGVEHDKIEKFMKKRKEDMTAGKNDFLDLYEYCNEQGVDINRTPFILPMLKFIASHKGRQDLLAFIPSKFDSTTIGYDYPLEENQLKEWISSY